MNKTKLIEEIIKIYEHKRKMQLLIHKHHKIIILGNGGSSATASHIAQDFTKLLNKNSFTFSDSPKLTCYANDYSWNNTYVEFLKTSILRDEKALVILISASGNSENILKCAKWCSPYPYISVVTLTGFDINNALNTINIQNRKLQIWVDSTNYGIVECVHQIFLHLEV